MWPGCWSSLFCSWPGAGLKANLWAGFRPHSDECELPSQWLAAQSDDHRSLSLTSLFSLAYKASPHELQRVIGRVFLDTLFGSDLVAWLPCQISATFHFNHEMHNLIEIDQALQWNLAILQKQRLEKTSPPPISILLQTLSSLKKKKRLTGVWCRPTVSKSDRATQNVSLLTY